MLGRLRRHGIDDTAVSQRARLLIALCALALARPAQAAEPLFEVRAFASPGRTVAAELADLNGDGRTDFFAVNLIGLPPEEERTVRVYLQRPDGSFPEQPNHRIALPEWSAVYDVADVRADSPGEEMVLLRPDGITLLSLADASGRRWNLHAPGATTVGLADDERGFERFRLVFDDFGPEPWILVPQLGQLSALTADGTLRARLALPRRANYFIVPPSGLIALETDFQIFVDVPKLSTGDVDGDGRVDFVSSTRHEIRVFLRREDGSYPFAADRRIPLRLVTARDHIRGSGGVASEIKDIDGDGLLDLLVSQVSGGFSDATSKIFVYMNHAGGWRMGEPDQVFSSRASLSSNALYDLDADGRLELVRLEFRFSLLEVIELMLSRDLDIELALHRLGPTGAFEQKPWFAKKLSLPFSFETFRLKGFVPTAAVDVDGDGLRDLVTSGGGKALEIHPGDRRTPFARRTGRQKMPTAGVIHFGDLDGNGLPDFILHDPHHFDAPLQIGRNLASPPAPPSAKKE